MPRPRQRLRVGHKTAVAIEGSPRDYRSVDAELPSAPAHPPPAASAGGDVNPCLVLPLPPLMVRSESAVRCAPRCWPARKALLDGRDVRPTLDLRSVFKAVLADHVRIEPLALTARVFPNSQGAPPLHGLIRA